MLVAMILHGGLIQFSVPAGPDGTFFANSSIPVHVHAQSRNIDINAKHRPSYNAVREDVVLRLQAVGNRVRGALQIRKSKNPSTLSGQGTFDVENCEAEPGSSAREFGPVEVPADHVFVLGDNRPMSSDSRFWGMVPLTHLKGRAHGLLWAYNSDDSVRWSRWMRGLR